MLEWRRHFLCLVTVVLSLWSFSVFAHTKNSAKTKAKTKAQAEQVLPGQWQFRIATADADAHPEFKQWRTATVPGHVHTDLLQHGLIPDPYVGMAEAGLQWIGKVGWEYQLVFGVDAKTLQRQHQRLQFEGLDTFAEVTLNGEPLLTTNNAFRHYEAQVVGKLRARDNHLLVRFSSPIQQLLPQVQSMPIKLAGNYPSPYGDEPKDAMTANFVRKPGYHYGWDWGPRYVTAGIWRPVKLITFDEARIERVQVNQISLNAEQANLVVRADVLVSRNLADSRHGELAAEVYAPDGSLIVKAKQTALSITNKPYILLEIPKPQLWYPNGYGKQNLYTIKLRLLERGRTIAEKTQRTGLRRVELDRHEDKLEGTNGKRGQAFTFVINGIPVFAKGANLIPFDMFPNRVPLTKQRQILQAARDANMNMLRIWGGGYYENDALYEMADEMGLMIWQDFMFGGGVVPGYDPEFRANVVIEARQQVESLRHHPSIVLWCGNNEEETAWKDWGIGKEMQKANPEFADKVWQGYRQLFGEDLRRVVQEHSLGVPYWSSSPSNDLDEKANDSDRGDKHYWEVWGGSKPVEDYLRETPRFMSEFGLQAWPHLSTIAAFSQKCEQQIDSPVIRQHQKFMAGEGNQRLLHYIRANYGEPKDFAHFVYLSQVMQAEGITLAIKHHRASMPRTMGSMYWQLNDVWPGASWSSIDYFGNWKALHYHARKAFAPLSIVAENLDGVTTLTVVSERLRQEQAQLRIRTMDFSGHVVREETIAFTAQANTATKIKQYQNDELLQGLAANKHFVLIDLIQNGKVVSYEELYFVAAKDQALSAPKIQQQWKKVGDHVVLSLKSKELTRMLELDFGKLEAKLSDNFVTLLPGQSIDIHIHSKADLSQLTQALHLRSLHSQ